jgi:hypothetical protein
MKYSLEELVVFLQSGKFSAALALIKFIGKKIAEEDECRVK